MSKLSSVRRFIVSARASTSASRSRPEFFGSRPTSAWPVAATTRYFSNSGRDAAPTSGGGDPRWGPRTLKSSTSKPTRTGTGTAARQLLSVSLTNSCQVFSSPNIANQNLFLYTTSCCWTKMPTSMVPVGGTLGSWRRFFASDSTRKPQNGKGGASGSAESESSPDGSRSGNSAPSSSTCSSRTSSFGKKEAGNADPRPGQGTREGDASSSSTTSGASQEEQGVDDEEEQEEAARKRKAFEEELRGLSNQILLVFGSISLGFMTLRFFVPRFGLAALCGAATFVGVVASVLQGTILWPVYIAPAAFAAQKMYLYVESWQLSRLTVAMYEELGRRYGVEKREDDVFESWNYEVNKYKMVLQQKQDPTAKYVIRVSRPTKFHAWKTDAIDKVIEQKRA